MSQLSPAQASRRVVERLGLGLTLGQSGEAQSVQSLLSQQGKPAGAVNLGPEPALDEGDTNAQEAAEATLSGQIEIVTGWWLDQMVVTDNPFVEKLTWFWHGHFATGPSMVRSARLLLAQNQTLRSRAAGNFADLVGSMVVDPAMLLWLNGDENRVGVANENLGRELMELFTLGVGNYTEADVKEAARALTGWTVDKASGTARLDPSRFDPRPKTVLGARIQDSTDLVDLLMGRTESIRYLITKVWSRFVSSQPPPADAVDRLVSAAGPTRNVRSLMTGLAAEPALLDPASVLVKQPVEWAVGLMRALGVRPSALSGDDAKALRDGLRILGQVPFDPPNVGGWPAGGLWLTTGSAIGRVSLSRLIAKNADLSKVEDQPAAGRAEAVTALLSIDPISDRSMSALRAAGDDPKTLVTVAACAPEYVVST